jgi:hypothetical protein
VIEMGDTRWAIRTMGATEVLLQLAVVMVVDERVGVSALADVARVVLALHVCVQRAIVVEPLPAEAAQRVALVPGAPQVAFLVRLAAACAIRQ